MHHKFTSKYKIHMRTDKDAKAAASVRDANRPVPARLVTAWCRA
jgi:hypothetical protein